MNFKIICMFLVWFSVISVPAMYLMGNHLNAFRPSHSELLAQLTDNDQFNALHFLGTNCACSENVYKKLISRAPSTFTNEHVFLIGDNLNWKNQLEKVGYKVDMHSEDFYENKFAIQAVPQLTIFKGKQMLYSGGYSSNRSLNAPIEDEQIMDEVVNRKLTEERPVYGCLSGKYSSSKQSLLDL